ncbi:hypothetical protein [Rhizosphaericola mali]|uniref:Uncharacterized protein n=1 Tax=Rhizosphaericola mali TaxID=2545455 RepID=A0A5P2GAC6_9BACT|nr:hypothetical protein [Rhizosphaericola mali]QES90133.1 hypothetical protein E0W69_016255 [Rhizosphaericola mali]
MIRRLRKYLICISLILIIVLQSTIACGPFLRLDEQNFSLFNPNLAGKGGLEIFYYSERLFNSELPDPTQKDYRRNCHEWRNICGRSVKEADIFSIQYEMNGNDFALNLLSKSDSVFNHNSFVKWLLLPSNNAFLDYMICAKKAEFTQFGNLDPWEDGLFDKNYDSLLFQSARDGQNGYQLVKNNFLKNRYTFQVLKSQYYLWRHGYTHYKDSLADLYSHIQLDTNSVIYGWSQLYYGLTLSGNDRTKLVLESFDHSESKKLICFQSLTKEDLSDLEKNTDDKYYKALCGVFQIINNPERILNKIKEIYSLDRNNKYLPFLLSREIDKIETWIWSPKYLGFNTKADNDYYASDEKRTIDYYAKLNYWKDRKYLDSVRSFLYEINTPNYSFHNFLNLSIAHLENVRGNYSTAMKLINQTPHFPNNKIFEQQRIVEEIISYANSENLNSSDCQQWLMFKIRELEAINPRFLINNIPSYHNYYYPDEITEEQDDDLSELLLMLSRRFQSIGNTMLAGLLYNKASLTTDMNSFLSYSDYDDKNQSDSAVNYDQIAYFDTYGTPATMDSLLSFKSKVNKSPFEKYISTALAQQDLYKDLKGTMFIRQMKYHAALDVFESMHQDYWAKNYEYDTYLPEHGLEYLGTITPWDSTKNVYFDKVSKTLLTKELCSLLDAEKVENDLDKKAGLLQRIANYQYNITDYGAGWMMLQYENSSAYFSPLSINTINSAMANYKKAYSIAKNTEIRASSLAMLHYCYKIIDKYYNKERMYGYYNYNSKYLTELKKRYKNSKTYTLAETHCPDFK